MTFQAIFVSWNDYVVAKNNNHLSNTPISYKQFILPF